MTTTKIKSKMTFSWEKCDFGTKNYGQSVPQRRTLKKDLMSECFFLEQVRLFLPGSIIRRRDYVIQVLRVKWMPGGAGEPAMCYAANGAQESQRIGSRISKRDCSFIAKLNFSGLLWNTYSWKEKRNVAFFQIIFLPQPQFVWNLIWKENILKALCSGFYHRKHTQEYPFLSAGYQWR